MLVGFLACYSPGLFGKNDWAAQNSGSLGLEPKMCPNHAQKVAFFEEKAQKLWVALRGGIRDPMYQKIWSIWDIFDLMTFLPLGGAPSRFAVSK